MLPEEKLQRSSAIARSQSQKQKAKYYKKPNSCPNATIIGYSTSTGQNIIQLPDGSISYAKSDTNGALAIGDSVPLHSGTMRVDGLPNIKRQPLKQKKAINKVTPYSFWLLFENYLFSIIPDGKTAILKIVAYAPNYPSPYDNFHFDTAGVIFNNADQFFMPLYYSINLYNIKNKSASTILGTNERDTSEIDYIRATSRLNQTIYISAVGAVETNYENQIIVIDGNEVNKYTPLFPQLLLDNEANINSIAAVNNNILYMVSEYQQLARYDLNASTASDIFHAGGIGSDYENVPSRYGNNILDSGAIEQLDYVFSDVKENCVYCTGFIKDAQKPGLQETYNIPSVSIIGEITENGIPLKIISGTFPGVICPGDLIRNSNTPWNAEIYRVVNDNTVYARTNITAPSGNGTFLDCSRQFFRTVIIKVDNSGNAEVYYKFPGIANRLESDGYRFFYGYPCRGAIINSITKDIYMQGVRQNIVSNGFLTPFIEGFDDKTIIKITKNKELVPLQLKFDSSIGSVTQAEIREAWYTIGQLESLD